MTTVEPSGPSAGAVTSSAFSLWPQTFVGIGVLLLGLGLAGGAIGISSEAGYGGVGPNFFPWVSAIALTLSGGWIIWEARSGGFREMDEPSGAPRGYWPGFVWVSIGLLANAALITTIGFILSCSLCYLLAVQGLRRASGQPCNTARVWITDAVTGLLISAPVFWMFTKFLAINLPGITSTGWL
ncbi:MAG: tripartite tricarboxylate transporter TctB family protein [Pseudomonadota bacterium]